MQKLNEDKIKLPLDEILLSNGYTLKKDKCSKNFRTLTNHNGESLVITRQANGHYLYFNPNELKDKGNIFSFCKNRNIKISQLLNKEFNYIELNHNINPTIINNKAIEFVTKYKELKPLENNNLLSRERFINEKIIKNFNTIKRDVLNNICIPMYIFDISVNGKDIISQSGYISYLDKPITKNKNGNPYHKPIKQLCYGNKGLEIIRNQNNKQKISEIQTILITESIIDSLSLYELKDYNPDTTLLCSTNGQVTKTHKELFAYFNKEATNAKIILGFDNDINGERFYKESKEIFTHKEVMTRKADSKRF